MAQKGQAVCFVIQCIQNKEPDSFILENVIGLLDFPETLAWIVDTLRSITNQRGEPIYRAHWEAPD